MDTIGLIILTAFINIVVTSIVSNMIFLRYQKKIENSFATLLFEHQTKFVRNYEKSVETLEMLNKKYVIFSDTLNNLISKQVLLTDKEGEDLANKLNDFWNYFRANRLFLPENYIDAIWKIHDKAIKIVSLSYLFVRITPVEINLISKSPLIHLITQHFELPDDWFDLKEPKLIQEKLLLMLNEESLALEKLYRLIAEVKQQNS